MISQVLLLLISFHYCYLDNVGWKSFLKEDPTEFHDIPLVWEGENTVPEWLSGTYVRNGPAQVSFRNMCNPKAILLCNLHRLVLEVQEE